MDEKTRKEIEALKEKYTEQRRKESEHMRFMRDHNFEAERIVIHGKIEVLDDIINDLAILLSPAPF